MAIEFGSEEARRVLERDKALPDLAPGTRMKILALQEKIGKAQGEVRYWYEKKKKAEQEVERIRQNYLDEVQEREFLIGQVFALGGDNWMDVK